MHLDLKSLQYFVRAAETGSFSQAALSFGVAQSVLSRHIGQLEALTKGSLFFRTGRGVALTELGQKMLPKAINVLREAGSFVDEAVSVQNQPEGTVRIGLLPGICGHLLNQLVPLLMEQYPGIRLNVLESHSGDIEMMLADGRLDIGLYNRYRPLRDHTREALYTRDMFLVAKVGSEALDGKSIRFSRLANLPLAMPRRPNSLRSIFEEIAAKKKLQINVVLEVNPSLAMQQVLLNCNVYTILPSHALCEPNNDNKLGRIPITHPAIKQTLYIDATRHHPPSSAARIVLRQITVLMRELVTTTFADQR